MQLGFGIAFPDLYEREGLLRARRRSSPSSARPTTRLRDRLIAARAKPPSGKEESELLVALAPHVEDFIAQALRHRGRSAGAGRAAQRARAALLGQAPVRAAPRAAQGQARGRAGLDGFASSRTELDFARKVTRVAARTRRRTRQKLEARRALRRLGDDDARRQGEASRAACSSRRRASSTSCAWCRCTRKRRDGFAEHTLEHLRQREGFALTDQGTDLVGALDEANYCIWCHEQGKDSCSKGLQEKAPADGFQEDGVRRAARRLPARGEDLRVPHGEGARPAARRARHHRGRQPDGRGHRPPHLQRLHEVLHLPEAGAGRHPAGRDAHAQGRARAAVGLRDLLAPHALESVRPAPPLPEGSDAAGACWSSASGPAGFTARAPPDERRPHGGRHRRPEDRAARSRRFRAWIRLGTASAICSRQGHLSAARAARRRVHGRLRRRRRVRHHGALGQEFPQDRSACCSSGGGSSRCSAACASAAR